MGKSQQDNVKDVGGFVGGKLLNGIRRTETLISRSLLTLDVDFADEDFIERFKMLNEYSYIIYSTHKHTREKPRLRLIFPFDRDCSSEEYQAIARSIANDIGLEMFDDTTYQAHRLMYYPSTSLDGEYFFEGEIIKEICVDEILNTYKDWKDSSGWYYSDRTAKNHQSILKKQQDPHSKKGVIGAFCRAYTIESVIDEHLSDIYQSCFDDRYTFIGGSTFGGAVVYGNSKFLYSNHATDPANSILCNSFDLVRIHKFGELDKEADENHKGKNLPSYIKAVEFAREDTKVKNLIHTERLSTAKQDFANFEDFSQEENTSWIETLEVDKLGRTISSIDNVKKILLNDNNLKGKIKLNAFSGTYTVGSKIPWNKEKYERDWKNSDDSNLRHYFEKIYKIKGEKIINDGLEISATEQVYHPVKQYLMNLTWDNTSRLEKLFIDYLGAEDTEYVRYVTKKALVACVARIFNPGCKFDLMLVLVGAQGCGKSSIIKKLGKDWFSDTLNSISDKNAYAQIKGQWIVEIAELSALKRADVESIKHFLSKSEDTYRGAYCKRVEKHKRQCVLFGTTNTHDFLKDSTGNRRFLPIDVDPSKSKTAKIFETFNDSQVDQIWAEAVDLYKKGEKIYLDDSKFSELVEEAQNNHLELSPLQGTVDSFLDILLPENWRDLDIYERRNFLSNHSNLTGKNQRQKVCIMEIWVEAFGGDKKELTRAKSNEIKEIILKNGNWVKQNKHYKIKNYGSQIIYCRKM